MTLLQKRLIILLVVIIVAAVLGRLVVRAFLNLLVGGTLFGGNFLRAKVNQRKKGELCGDSSMLWYSLPLFSPRW